ncbi:MAG: hypothetical protein ACYDBB_22125 [Armatimonadota bacterium]
MQTSLTVLAETITDWWMQNDLFDPACVFGNTAIFIESYAVRGGIARVRRQEMADGSAPSGMAAIGAVTRADGLDADALVRRDMGDAAGECERALAGAYAFCDRVVEHQGVQGPPEALMMGYGLRVRDGMVQHACVADQASIALAVLDTVALRPTHPHAAGWLAAIERWAGWVLANFTQPNGGIGVGIFCHQWNPLPEYWCATSLATAVLFALRRQTGKAAYADPALAGLDWLARFDYTAVDIPRFTDCAPEVALYTFEGLVAGTRYLCQTQGVDAARSHPAARQFASLAQWLIDNQSSDGRWPEPPERGYRDYSAGVPWLLLEMDALIGPNAPWRACARRVLDGLMTTEGACYYGLYVRPFTTGLAWLSACAAV